jgi:hypothetical protein
MQQIGKIIQKVLWSKEVLDAYSKKPLVLKTNE